MTAWIDAQADLADLAQRTLFFVGGAPRTGTTWLQHLLDAHPDICCRGEGHFLAHLVEPLGTLMAGRRAALEAKNQRLFVESGGYPLPKPDDFEVLAGTAILLALHQQTDGQTFACIGEKTPENVFYFPNLKRLFPRARFVGIVRDPRDSLSSAWHMFRPMQPGEDEEDAKFALLRRAFPSLQRGTRLMLEYQAKYPDEVMIVRYESMIADPASVAATLYRFLGVSDAADVIARSVARTSFQAMSGGRSPGQESRESFFRKGVPGDWRATLTPAMSNLIRDELGWMYTTFGWDP